MGDFAPSLARGPKIFEKMKLFSNLQRRFFDFDALFPDLGNFGRWQPAGFCVKLHKPCIMGLAQSGVEFVESVPEGRCRRFEKLQLILKVLESSTRAVKIGGRPASFGLTPGGPRPVKATVKVSLREVFFASLGQLPQVLGPRQDFRPRAVEPCPSRLWLAPPRARLQLWMSLEPPRDDLLITSTREGAGDTLEMKGHTFGGLRAVGAHQLTKSPEAFDRKSQLMKALLEIRTGAGVLVDDFHLYAHKLREPHTPRNMPWPGRSGQSWRVNRLDWHRIQVKVLGERGGRK